MKLSIVIICFDDLNVIRECLRSVYAETNQIEFEVIISDNGSRDGSVEFIREHHPQARIVENGANLGFARGNNAGIRVAQGEYVLILNPDTVILDRAIEKLVAYADRHPEGGAFGCRVLNPDGSYQDPAHPLPTVGSLLVSALCLRWLGRISGRFTSDTYVGWSGQTEREIGFQCGCCILFPRDLLTELGGFDEQFFYHCEEKDLCCRAWKAGRPVLFYPGAEITHLGGQTVGRFPIRSRLETYRSSYRYFHKHFGAESLGSFRRVMLIKLFVRWVGYGIVRLIKPGEALAARVEMLRVLFLWNRRLEPLRFVRDGTEPDVGYAPLGEAVKKGEESLSPREVGA